MPCQKYNKCLGKTSIDACPPLLQPNLELHIAIIAQIYKRYFKEIPVVGELVGVDLPV